MAGGGLRGIMGLLGSCGISGFFLVTVSAGGGARPRPRSPIRVLDRRCVLSRNSTMNPKHNGLPKVGSPSFPQQSVLLTLRPAILHVRAHLFNVLVEDLLLVVGQDRLELIALLLLDLTALGSHFLLIAASRAERLHLLAVLGLDRVGFRLLSRGEGDVFEEHRRHIATAPTLLLRILRVCN